VERSVEAEGELGALVVAGGLVVGELAGAGVYVGVVVRTGSLVLLVGRGVGWGR
jgi:hypothetical protein